MRWHTRTVGSVSISSANTASARFGPSLKARLPNACSKHSLSALQSAIFVSSGSNARRRDLALRRGLGDVGGDRVDLIVRERAAECGHAASSLRDLACDAVGVGLERVEAGAGRPFERAALSAWQRPQPASAKTAAPVSDAVAGSASSDPRPWPAAARAANETERQQGEGKGHARHPFRVRRGRTVVA